jgi:hypothetical protein
MAGGEEWDLRQQKALRLYLEETHAFPLLSRAEENQLAQELNLSPRTVRTIREQAFERLRTWAGRLREDGESDQRLLTPPEDEGQKSTSPGASSLEALMLELGKVEFIETYGACLRAHDLRAVDLGFNEYGERILTNAQIAASLGGTANENNIKQRLWRIGKKVSGRPIQRR